MTWYDDTGTPGDEAPVLVLLHAFPLSSAMWDRLVPELESSLRVVRVDLPGLGRTAAPDAAPSVTAMAQAVLDVLDARGVDRAHVFGLSTGGYVALVLADLAPDRVTTLVLGSTTCWVTAPDVPQERRSLADRLERARTVDALLPDADQGLGPTAHAEQPDLVTLLRGVVAAADPQGVAWTARAIAGRDDTSSVVEAFAGRMLLVWGEEDTDTPLEVARAIADLRPPDDRTVLVTLPRTGHLTGLEQPTAVAGHLAAFLLADPAGAGT